MVETYLVGEASGKIANTSLAITSDIRNLSNVVEHVSTSEKKYSNQADGRPNVSVLKNRKEIRPRHTQDSY